VDAREIWNEDRLGFLQRCLHLGDTGEATLFLQTFDLFQLHLLHDSRRLHLRHDSTSSLDNNATMTTLYLANALDPQPLSRSRKVPCASSH